MTGEIVHQSNFRHPLAIPNVMGPFDAVSKTLAVYLEGIEFRVNGGDTYDQGFYLNKVLEEFPSSSKDLDYPTASIVERGPAPYAGHSFTPTPLEDTLGTYDSLICGEIKNQKTVLFKEGEYAGDLQVDFWLATSADRKAVAAALGHLFNPVKERAGVLLKGPPQYYDRNILFTLLDVFRDDTSDTSYQNEFRLRCNVRGESDIVSLRLATLLQPTKPCIIVSDPSDPEDI
jgi:hypothetical protein